MSSSASHIPVAVIGIGCRYPDASSPEEFWRNQSTGRQSFAPVDPTRWDHSRFYTSGRDTDGTPCDRVAHLRHIDRFAAGHFNIAARRAEVMDPQQRLLLEVTWEATQDAGLRPDRYDRSRSAAYVGCSVSEYAYLVTGRLREKQMQAGQFGTADDLARTQRIASIRAYTMPGSLLSMSASVLTQCFDWGGPSLAMDGACASSLLSLHHACEYLRSLPSDEGELAPVAVAAGVYLNIVPDNFVAFARIGALAHQNSTAFDESASGFLLGEGAGSVVLKRLDLAQRDGDRIYAVIRGTVHNSDGAAPTPMTPVLSGQERLLGEGLRQTGIPADSIGYLECHGTGTPVGDEIELQAWRSMLGDSPHRPWIGSAKANFGHTLSAAGMAGFLRATLAIYHREIPCHAGFKRWHPKLAPLSDHFQVAQKMQPWNDPLPRAAVSSFGFGGINCLALLEGVPTPKAPPEPDRELPFLISAPNADLLDKFCRDLTDTLTQGPRQPLAWVAYTLSVARRPDKHRQLVWAQTQEALLEALKQPAEAALRQSSRSKEGSTLVAERDSFDELFTLSEQRVADLPPGPLERKSFWVVGQAAIDNATHYERQVRSWLARTCGLSHEADLHLVDDLGLDEFAVVDLLALLPPQEKPLEREQLRTSELLRLCRQADEPFVGTKLNPITHPFLLDHSMNKSMLLPLASGLDFLAWNADLQVPWAMDSVEVNRGLLFRDSAEVKLQREGQNLRMFDVRPDGRELLIMSARVGVFNRPPTPAHEIEAEWDLTGELARFYREVTFHGTRLQGIASLEKGGSRGVVGSVRTSIPRDWIPGDPRSRWNLDPLVVDSCLQLALYWVTRHCKRAVLPWAIAEIAMQGQLSPGLVDVRLYHMGTTDMGPVADVIMSQSGRVVGWMRGVQGRWVESLPQRSWQSLPMEWTDAKLLPEVVANDVRLDWLAEGGKFPYFKVIPPESINFCAYNYVGLARHPRVLQAAADAVMQFGCSAGASRVVGGELELHNRLEARLSRFLGQEDSLAMVGGHATNVSVLSHFMGKRDLILHDSLAHNSILQGAMASQARRLSFPHNDVAALEQILRKVRTRFRRVLIVAEGIYSMDGDIAPLSEIVQLRQRYGCLLMVDEAHSLGVLGNTGRGICEHFGVNPREVDILMGTLSKTLGSTGGYLSGSAEIIRFLRTTMGGFVFSVGLSPPLTAAADAALTVLEEEPQRVERLQQLSAYFWRGCKQLGLPVGLSEGTPVLPVILGSSRRCIDVCHEMGDRGIQVKPIIHPAVEEKAARIRFFLGHDHTEEQLDYTLKTLRELLS